METLSKNKIKWIRSLRLKKNRDSEQLFIVEGEKMVNELINEWPENIELIITNDNSFNFNGEIYLADEKSMQAISNLKTPNKLFAVAKIPKIHLSKKAAFILVLDDIQDPGNMGTILRTADWFNVDEIICSRSTVDIYNSKVVQSSMGSVFRVKTTYTDLSEYLSKSELPIYGALLEGESIYDKDLNKEGIIVMGNEGKGISKEITQLIQERIHIPRFGHSESLNVAVATAIILSEFSRN